MNDPVRIPKFPQVPKGEVPSVPPHVGVFVLTFVACPSCNQSDLFVFDEVLNVWSCENCRSGIPAPAMAVFREDNEWTGLEWEEDDDD